MAHSVTDFLRRISRRGKTKTLLLLNPISGHGHAKKNLSHIVKAARQHLPDFDLEINFSRKAGDLAVCAREAIARNCELVIVAGGDGAINEVIQGMAGSHVPLGIIPRGTANVFAEETGIPTDIVKACRTIAEGYVKRVDLGVVNGRYFLWLAGIGVDALVAYEVHSEIKDQLGVMAYVSFALKHAKNIPCSQVKIAVDGKEINEQAVAVLVGNAATYDGDIKIQGVEQMDDGYLDVCVVKKLTPLFIARAILFFMLGSRRYYRDLKYVQLRYFKATALQVESHPPVYCHTDGEVIGQTPLNFRMAPQSLSLILPQP